MSRFKMVLASLTLGVGVVGLIVMMGRRWDGVRDLKIGVIDDSGLRVINISPERRMINVLKVVGGVEVWIPEGLGWYRADKVRRVLDQEDKKVLLGKIYFYNFGFIPEMIWDEDDLENWMESSNLSRRLGIGDYLLYEKQSWGMVINETEIKNNLDDQQSTLGNVIPRDFADMGLGSEDVRIGVYNCSREDKLASFLSDRIEWAGMNVTTVENSSEKVERCLMTAKDFKVTSKTVGLLRQIFDCEEKVDTGVGDNEIDLYFGEGYVSMLKYSNYVRTF
jgi:hypothetical protein